MRRIVVASNDPDALSLLGNTLEFRGYKVMTAGDGQQAWQLILRTRPDLAILEVSMPALNGFEVCRRLRTDPSTRNIAVVFLSDGADVSDKVAGFEAGGDDYLVKPFHPRELVARVSALLRRAASSRLYSLADGPPGELVALFGAKGGVGTTALAVNLAVALALTNTDVCLVDLDLDHSVAGMLLDLLPSRQGTIADLSRRFEEGVDWSVMRQHLVTHGSGVSLLPGPATPAHAELVTSEQVKVYLEILRQRHSHVIVDLPSNFRDINLDIFESCDRLLLVVAPELPALKSFRCAAEVLQRLGIPSSVMEVVVNQPTSSPGLSQDQVKRGVSLRILANIPYGGEEFAAAVNRGVPLVQKRPQHPTSLAIKKLAEALRPPTDVAGKGAEESQRRTRATWQLRPDRAASSA